MARPKPATERWRTLALVCTTLVLTMITWFSATAVTPQIVTAFALGEAAAAGLTNAVQLGFVIGALVLALTGLADRWPPHVLMAGAALLTTLANLGLLVATDTAGILLARVATGIGLAGIYPPALKLVATWFRRGRGLAMGAAIGALTLGSALPHLVRAYAVALDWRSVVATASGLTLLGGLVIVVSLREGPFSFERSSFAFRQVGDVLCDRRLLLTNLGYFGHMWELYAVWGWFLAFAAAAPPVHALADPAAPSLLTFCMVGSGVLGCLLGGYLADRVGRVATTAGMLAVSGACAGLIGFTFDGPLWLFLLVAVIWGVAVIGDSAQFSAIVTEVGDPRLIGTALTLQIGLGFALTVVVIQLVPIVAGLVGWRWVFLFLLPGPGLGVLAMLRLPEAVTAWQKP